jgi:hypothetical protein
VVVNLAIENDPDCSTLVGRRLLARLKVDDAQAAHGQPDVLRDVEAIVIGSSMHDLTVHGLKRRAQHFLAVLRVHQPAYSTHI